VTRGSSKESHFFFESHTFFFESHTSIWFLLISITMKTNWRTHTRSCRLEVCGFFYSSWIVRKSQPMFLSDLPLYFHACLRMFSHWLAWGPRRLYERIFCLSNILLHTCINHGKCPVVNYLCIKRVVNYNIVQVGYLHSPQHQYLCIERASLI
jgi:hypothetical protein